MSLCSWKKIIPYKCHIWGIEIREFEPTLKWDKITKICSVVFAAHTNVKQIYVAQTIPHMVGISILGSHVNGFGSSYGKKTPCFCSALYTRLIHWPKLTFWSSGISFLPSQELSVPACIPMSKRASPWLLLWLPLPTLPSISPFEEKVFSPPFNTITTSRQCLWPCLTAKGVLLREFSPWQSDCHWCLLKQQNGK